MVQSLGSRLTKKMTEALNAFGIPIEDLRTYNLQYFNNAPSIKAKKEYIIDPEVIPLPDHFYKLDDVEVRTNHLALIAADYLERRNIDYNSYPFYLSEDKLWKRRLIIPIYKDGKLIFYQGRALLDVIKRKYLSPNVSKTKILFGYEQIFAESDSPLFIAEGFFDAFHLDGIALLGKKLYKEQIDWISKTRRQKVLIPDRTGGVSLLVKKVIQLGWSISTPDIGGCKDISEAISKYGKVYVLSSVMSFISSGSEALMRFKLYIR